MIGHASKRCWPSVAVNSLAPIDFRRHAPAHRLVSVHPAAGDAPATDSVDQSQRSSVACSAAARPSARSARDARPANECHVSGRRSCSPQPCDRTTSRFTDDAVQRVPQLVRRAAPDRLQRTAPRASVRTRAGASVTQVRVVGRGLDHCQIASVRHAACAARTASRTSRRRLAVFAHRQLLEEEAELLVVRLRRASPSRRPADPRTAS